MARDAGMGRPARSAAPACRLLVPAVEAGHRQPVVHTHHAAQSSLHLWCKFGSLWCRSHPGRPRRLPRSSPMDSTVDATTTVETPSGIEVVIGGRVAPGFEGVRDAFTANFVEHGEVGAGFSLVHDGRTVVDLWGGVADAATGAPYSEDTLQLIFSSTKGATAA